MSKILVDTNVLIYSIDKSYVYLKESNRLITSNKELYTTSKNLSEFLSVTTRLPKPLSLVKALTIVKDLKGILSILYPNHESYNIFEEILRKYQPTGLIIHDYEIISIGLANNINRFVTYNQKDFNGIDEIDLVNNN